MCTSHRLAREAGPMSQITPLSESQKARDADVFQKSARRRWSSAGVAGLFFLPAKMVMVFWIQDGKRNGRVDEALKDMMILGSSLV